PTQPDDLPVGVVIPQREPGRDLVTDPEDRVDRARPFDGNDLEARERWELVGDQLGDLLRRNPYLVVVHRGSCWTTEVALHHGVPFSRVAPAFWVSPIRRRWQSEVG